jgi:energy-coupling factor transport system substrate-specific component
MNDKQHTSRFDEQNRRDNKNNSRQVIYGLVGAVLYGLFSWITNLFPLPAVGIVIFRPAVALLIFFGIAYGPLAGMLAGFLGGVISDFLTGLDYYWNWSVSNALIGMVAGLFMIKSKDLGMGREILRAIAGGTLGIIVGMMFGSLSEIFFSGIDLGTALFEYFPIAFLGSFASAILLLPLFMIAYAALVSRWAR